MGVLPGKAWRTMTQSKRWDLTLHSYTTAWIPIGSPFSKDIKNSKRGENNNIFKKIKWYHILVPRVQFWVGMFYYLASCYINLNFESNISKIQMSLPLLHWEDHRIFQATGLTCFFHSHCFPQAPGFSPSLLQYSDLEALEHLAELDSWKPLL